MQMKKQWLMAAVLGATLLAAGCGGGSDSISSPPAVVVVTPPPTTPPPPAPTIADSVSTLIAFMQNLIATSTNETGEPIDINGLTLVTDNTVEPSAI